MDAQKVKEWFQDLDWAKCETIAQLCNGELEIDADDISEQFAGTKSWVNQCYNYPDQDELVRSALNDVLGGFGVEVIRNPDDEIIAEYINVGETYKGTIVYDYAEADYVLTTWGDWYEDWLQRQNEENDTIQCGWCSHLTPKDESDWRKTICEECGNYVNGTPGPNHNEHGRKINGT